MKNVLNKVAMFASVVLLASACTNDLMNEGVDNNAPLSEDVVVLSGDLADSRVLYEHPDGGSPLVTNWKNADGVGVVMYDNTTKTVFQYRHLYKAQSDGTTTTLAPDQSVQNPTTWSKMASFAEKNGGYNYTIYAIYPYDGAIQHYEVPFSVPSQQTQSRINNGDHIAATDAMMAKVTITEEPKNKSINLTFKHMLSILELQLTSKNGSVKVDKFVLEFEDTAEVVAVDKGKYNPSNGAFYNLANAANVTNPSNKITLTLAEPAVITPASNHQVFMQIIPGHSGKRFTITAYDGSTVVGSINKKFNSALPAGKQAQLSMVLEGAGVNYGGAMTEVWTKDLSAIAGVTPLNVSGLAVSGDYLVLNEIGSTTPVYLNRLTGAKVGAMNLSAIGTVNKAIPFHSTSDDAGNILFCNRTNVDNGGSTFKIWKAKGVGAQPSLLLSCTVNASQRYGWHISVQGSVDGDAIITTPIHSIYTGEAKFARWQVKGGEVVSQTPTIVAMPLSASDSYKYSWGDIVYAEGNNPESDYFVASHISDATHGRNLFWIDGIKNSQVVAMAPGDSQYNTTMTSTDYIECGGVSYVAYNYVNSYTQVINTSNAVMLYRLGKDSFDTPIYVCPPNTLRTSKATTDTATAYAYSDVLLHAEGGELFLYAVFADGKVGCFKMATNVTEPTTTPIEGVNVSVGKFYTTSVAPVTYTDENPVVFSSGEVWSSGTKLTDGVKGTTGSSEQFSQGLLFNKDVDVVIDLGKSRPITKIQVGAVQNKSAGYGYPGGLVIYGSNDGNTWDELGTANYSTVAGQTQGGVNSGVLPGGKSCRYVKVCVSLAADYNYLMLDEITVTGIYHNDMKYVPQSGAYHGAFNNSNSFEGEEGDGECPLDVYEERVGKDISMMLWYQGMNPTRKFSEIQEIRRKYAGKGFDGQYRFFMYGWLPESTLSDGTKDPEKSFTAAQLATGALDNYWREYFEDVKSVQRNPNDYGPVWFRPVNEMNSTWTYWGNDAPNFVKFWRRMYNIAERVGITDYNVFVWSSNDISFGKYTMAEYYPGDLYCDWIGTSCYFSTKPAYGYPSYLMNETESISANKPVMITEGGFGSDDCDNSLWVREWFGLKTTHPRVKAVVWENHHSGTQERRICRDAAALSEYQRLVKDSYWLDRIPSKVLDEAAVRKARQNMAK